jgi:hypothetical protein
MPLFNSGDEVIVTDDHLLPAYRGDTGKIERVVGFEKYYVLLKRHGKTMVHEKNLKLSALIK